MKILWVKSDFLHPTRGGGQIRTLETLRRLHRRHQVHFAALDLPQPGAGSRHSSEYCTKAYPVPHPNPPQSGPRYWAQIARGPWTSMPLPMLRYRSQALLRLVEVLTRLEKFDAIVCDFLASAANIPQLGNAVLFQHNVESAIWKRHTDHAPTPLHRAFCRAQYQRMLRYEGEVCRQARRVIAVSSADACLMQSLYAAPRVAAVPTGVDLEYFAHPAGTPPVHDLVFVGAMDWRPNIDGLNWFIHHVLPHIRMRRPCCSLVVVGRNPTADVCRLAAAAPHIHVTGTVDDVRPYLWESAVSIAPLRIGGGTRLKIYESMAAKIPVVSTSVGAEGLDIRHGENIAIADSPQQFAQACLALLDDEGARRRMAANAWETVAACYSWEVVSSQFEQTPAMIPFLDLGAQYRELKPEIDAAVSRVLESGQFVGGPEVLALEEEFAAYCGARHGVAVNSGTSALHLALLAAGIQPGDEVITVPFTFYATVAAIGYVGATAVYVDIDAATFNMDPAKIEAAITERTRAILLVHLYGQCADMDPILEIARRRKLIVIEDAAQAHGAEYRGRRAGGMGDIGCFSFYPTKNLGAAGEGGLLTTNNPEYARQAALLRSWGEEQRYRPRLKGFNYRLPSIQAAILRVKLRRLEAWTVARRALAAEYDRLLAGSGVTPPHTMHHSRHAYCLYTIRASDRDALQRGLAASEIQTAVHYPLPIHLMPAYADARYKAGDFPVAEACANSVLSLPLHSHMSAQQVEQVASSVCKLSPEKVQETILS